MFFKNTMFSVNRKWKILCFNRKHKIVFDCQTIFKFFCFGEQKIVSKNIAK